MLVAQRDVRNRAVRQVVAAFGAGLPGITFSTTGVPVEKVTRHDVRVDRFLVARPGQAVAATMTPAGLPATASFEGFVAPSDFPTGDLVATAGGVEVRRSPGAVTGRSLGQVFLRRSASVYVPLTGGPEPVKLLTADTVAGTGTLRRNGVARAVKWRPTPLGVGETAHLALVVGQSLAQGHSDTGVTERVPPWRDWVADRAWQFGAGDGLQRGPRPFPLIPIAGNRFTVIAPAQLLTLEPLRGSSHAYFLQQGQTCCKTLALALLGQQLHPRDHVIGAIVGTGSTAIVDVLPGTAHFQSAQAVITAATGIAAVMRGALQVWLIWNQGEEDNDLGTAQATYEAGWLSIRNGLSAQAVSAGATFGGAVIQQTLQRTSGVTGMVTLAHARLIAAGHAAGVMATAMADVPCSGSTHLLPPTDLPWGRRPPMRLRARWQPLQRSAGSCQPQPRARGSSPACWARCGRPMTPRPR